MRRAALIAVSIALLATPAGAVPPPEESGLTRFARSSFDAVLLRPMGAAATVVGGVLFGVTYPITYGLKKQDHARKDLVMTPYRETFQRPLGEW